MTQEEIDSQEAFKVLMQIANYISANNFRNTTDERYMYGQNGYSISYGYQSCTLDYFDSEIFSRTQVLTIIKGNNVSFSSLDICGTSGAYCYNPDSPMCICIKDAGDYTDLYNEITTKFRPFTLDEDDYFQYSTVLKLKSYEYYKTWADLMTNTELPKDVMVYWDYRKDTSILLNNLLLSLQSSI